MNEIKLAETEGALEVFCAAARRLMKQDRACEAERIYKQALRLAEREAGKTSPLTGLVLLELMRFYEEQGRDEEAEAVWERIRQLVIGYLERDPGILVRTGL
jgi:tetratricopeptide (TPR) repeat protein